MNKEEQDLLEHIVEFLKTHSARELLIIATEALEKTAEK